MNNQNQQQNLSQWAKATHCPHCNRCFCGTAKLQAIDGTAICSFCKPPYEQRLNQGRQ